MHTRVRTIVLVPVLLMMMTGCEKKEKSGKSVQPSTVKESSVAFPAGLFVSSEIPNAIGVAEARADGTLSGEVVIRGRIGGRRDPFVDGVAMFLLADEGMKSCDQRHGDSCKTPWDYCCEPDESLLAKRATIQIVGDDGKPLRMDIKGKHGLTSLATVTVKGEVVSNEHGVLIVNARRIHLHCP